MKVALKYKRLFKDMSIGTLKLSPSSHIVASISVTDEGISPVLWNIVLTGSILGSDNTTIAQGKASCEANAKKQINNAVEDYMISQSIKSLL
jgi:hypothetical protein